MLSNNELSILKRALSNPPKIVKAFLSRSSKTQVTGGGNNVVFDVPAGGRQSGWWSNGSYLIYKDKAFAGRTDGGELTCIQGTKALFEKSGLISGLTLLEVSALN